MRGSCEQETGFLLYQWGLWQMCTIGRTTSPMAGVMQVVGGVSRGLEIHINDDQGLMVDRAVAALKARDKELFQIVELKFLKRYPNKYIEQMLGQNRFVVERRLAGAISWIDCFINIESCRN